MSFPLIDFYRPTEHLESTWANADHPHSEFDPYLLDVAANCGCGCASALASAPPAACPSATCQCPRATPADAPEPTPRSCRGSTGCQNPGCGYAGPSILPPPPGCPPPASLGNDLRPASPPAAAWPRLGAKGKPEQLDSICFPSESRFPVKLAAILRLRPWVVASPQSP